MGVPAGSFKTCAKMRMEIVRHKKIRGSKATANFIPVEATSANQIDWS
jgi:hypothetical protein